MARALIVAGGRRGRALGAALAAGGWQVRATSRDAARARELTAAGLEGVVADPADVGSVFELVEGVAIVYWLLGSATGEPADVEAVNGARLESLLERLVDTPVRGLVYEAAGSAPSEHLATGAEIAGEAARRWRIPVEVVYATPAERDAWLEAMLAAGERSLLDR